MFKVIKSEQISDNFVVYNKKEQAIWFGIDLQTNFSFMLGDSYVSLEVDLGTKKIEGVYGFCPMRIFEKASISIPYTREKGNLYFENWDYVPGTGKTLSPKKWYFFIDKKNKTICISSNSSKYVEDGQCVEFMKNAFALIRDNSIIKLWLMFVEK